MTANPDDIAAAIVALCAARGAGKTICPSEVARAVVADGDWRAAMDDVRAAAAQLAARGEIDVTQRGRSVDIQTVRGPVRLSLK